MKSVKPLKAPNPTTPRGRAGRIAHHLTDNGTLAVAKDRIYFRNPTNGALSRISPKHMPWKDVASGVDELHRRAAVAKFGAKAKPLPFSG